MASTRRIALLIWLSRDGWSAYVPETLEEPIASGESIETAARSLEEIGLASTPVVIALESELCLTCRFEVATRRQARSREVLAFKAEEELPVAAEELASDYLASGVHIFGVSANRRQIEGTLDALTSLDIRGVAPLALLAAQEYARDAPLGVTRWLRRDQVEQIEIGRSGITSWRTLPAEENDLETALIAQRLAEGAGEAFIGLGDLGRVSQQIPNSCRHVVECSGDPCLYYALQATSRIGRGEKQPAIDLRRDPVLRRLVQRNPLSRDLALLGLAALVLIGAAAAQQYRKVADSLRELQRLESAEAEVFREVFPDKRLPRGVRARLESEHRRLVGARPDSASAPEHRDAAVRLQSLLESLPKDLRFRLTEVRIEGSRVSLLGEARSHADADRIATALRRSGLAVDPPSTRQLAVKGVEYRLAAEEIMRTEQP